MLAPQPVLAPHIRADVGALQAMQYAGHAQAGGERVAGLAQQRAHIAPQVCRRGAYLEGASDVGMAEQLSTHRRRYLAAVFARIGWRVEVCGNCATQRLLLLRVRAEQGCICGSVVHLVQLANLAPLSRGKACGQGRDERCDVVRLVSNLGRE